MVDFRQFRCCCKHRRWAMSFFTTMSCPLQALSLRVRLILIVSCFLLCGLIGVVSESLLHTSRAAALFVLPVCLASWCFKQRGAFLSVAGLLPSLAVLNTLEAGRSLLWPRATPWDFLFGGVGLLALGVLVALMKQALELSQLARAKAQQAEVRLQRLQLVRNQFLVNVTHELRLLVDNILNAAHTTNGMRPPHCEVLHIADLFQDVVARIDPATREAHP